MEKLKLHTPDLTAGNIEKLAALFPDCITEARDENGNLTRAVDFDQLRQELSTSIVEGPRERYHLDWPGKREALLAANAPIAKTLRPCREESVDFDTTKNIFIEGDNLDALKLLQETYLNKVKLIYIDPPYNTGNDFIYEDDFAENSESFFVRSNQKDDEGNRLIANTETNGRFHSNWLSMIYSRVKLARNLLTEDGIIFISIDDHEVANLRRVCDEVFGEANFVATIVWQKRYVSNVTAKWLSDMHDFVVVYSRNKEAVTFHDWARTEAQEAAYKNPDSDPRGVWRAQDLSASKPYAAGLFEIHGPTGIKFSPPPNRYWRCNEAQFNEWRRDKRIWWGVNNDARPMLKAFRKESERGITPHTWWEHEFAGHNKEATLEVKELFAGNSPFDTPKPVRLLTRILELGTTAESLVLDFFSGSASMAHAVVALNAADGGARRYVMVQLPVPCDPGTEAFKSGYTTIADTGKERIRRSGAKVKSQTATTVPNLDIGFRVLKIDTSNMKDIYYTPNEIQQRDLLSHLDNIREDRTPEDLLFQVLVDWGIDLALPIATETIAGKTIFFVDGNALAACFESDISEELVKELAKRKPLRAVFRDSSYGSDSVKINVEQIFRLLAPSTEIKSL
jgi:adenine-specific DNA-methyltransferase